MPLFTCLMIVLAQQYSPCLCLARPAHVILDVGGECLYWYYDDEADKNNPCVNVPDSAIPIFLETDNGNQQTNP